MTKKFSVTVVGPGSLGGALAVSLDRAGLDVREIIYRSDRVRAQKIARQAHATAVEFKEALPDSSLVWICVADNDIGRTARALKDRLNWKGKYVFHSSGALSSGELAPLKRNGARVASVHPMMSFVRTSEASFKNVSFALEGDIPAVRLAAKIARALGGTSFNLKKNDKPLYHAMGAFSSPLLVAQWASAEKIGRTLGLKPEQTRKVIAPILQMTLHNYLTHGPAEAFSGPLIRGDVQTVASNLKALERVQGTGEIYRALAQMALGELPVKELAAIRKLLLDPTNNKNS